MGFLFQPQKIGHSPCMKTRVSLSGLNFADNIAWNTTVRYVSGPVDP